MRKSFYRRYLLFAAALAVMLSSCSAPVQEIQEESGVIPLQMEEEPILDYPVTEMYPFILIDRRGYNSGGSKVAVIHGENLPGSFRLVDKATGEVVYTGSLEKRGYNEALREYNSYGDFTDFTQAGEYYLECDIIGRSYSFRIEEALYQEVLREAVADVLEDSQSPGKDVNKLSRAEIEEKLWYMLNLLLSYELYPSVYTDEGGNQIPDILEAVTNMVREISNIQDIQTGSAGEYSYAYAAVLAKYSYLYQKCDSVFATEVLNLADKAWRYGEKAGTGQEAFVDREYRMLAAAELYRATGQYKYRVIMGEYGYSEEDSGRAGTLAKVTYISTKQRVDVNLCSEYMKELMLVAEEIARKASGTRYLTIGEEIVETDGAQSKDREAVMDEMMWDITVLSVVEYVITNQEYGKVLENQYHYFMGRNPQAVFYELQENPIEKAGFILILSEMIANR